ncbi:HAMP domain-containing sensor histidine kinase [Maribellus sp. YY47]|uniref:tetratricopeptide repeat-containing sensor histidine kinase n=1 Tax=Maribellus sp. YY47 TaxID=2929486 RepID=UPI002000B1C6|nr:HAMP domain-containing sensor histidine kinase [Maribellus sp. YY47]MCK3683711.1 ATP-binding protein [Maribellus sp. YY47]
MKIKYIHATQFLFFCLAVLFSFSSFAFTEKIDSLKTVCRTETDTSKLIDNYNSLAGYFAFSSHDSSLFYAEKALNLAQQTGYTKGEGVALFRISYSYDLTGNWKQAITNLEKAIVIFEEIKDTTFLVASYLNLGLLYSYGSDFVKGLEYTIIAKNLSENQNYESAGLTEAYTNIGWYYEYIKDYRSAYRYYMKALNVAERLNQEDNIAVLSTGLCYVNIKLKNLDEALNNLERTLKLLPEMKDPHMETYAIILSAYYYLETDNLDEAETNIEQAEKMVKKQNFERLKAEVVYLHGSLALKQKNYAEALTYFDTALKYCEKLDRHDLDTDIFSEKTKALAELGRYKEAYQMQHLEEKTNQLLQPNKIAQVLGEFEHQELVKEQQQQNQLHAKLAEEKNRHDRFKSRIQFYFAALAAVLLVIVVIILAYYLWLRKKHAAVLNENYKTINKQKILLERNLKQLEEDEKKLKELNATKDKFFSIIAHDLKNPFNVLIGISDLLRTNSDIKNSKDFETLIEGMFQTATSGYNLLENLLEWSRTQTGNLQFDPQPFYINKVLSTNEILFKEAAKSKNLTINWPSNREMVVADFNMVNFIFRNLLNNAIKFSYEGDTIDVSVSANGKMLECSIRDHGMGMDENTLQKLFKVEYSIQKDGTANEKGTGLGLILCKEFVEKNGGEIRVSSTPGEGSLFSFSLPLKRA